MLIKRLFSFILIILILSVSCLAYASIDITDNPVKSDNCVYVAGNPDFYPLEYYNPETKRYSGVLPQILNDISEDTGTKFVYIYNDELTQMEIAGSHKAQMVSAYLTDGTDFFVSDRVTVLSYSFEGKSINVGFAFTDTASPDLINAVKHYVSDISQRELSGYLVSASSKSAGEKSWGFITIMLCTVFLVIIGLLLFFSERNAKKQMMKNKMTDDETGIGNVLHFEKHFNHLISDFEKGKHYISYIVIDSNYIQVYHGASVFTDVLKYTADILKASELSARITENGFAVIFKAENETDATNKMHEIISKISSFLSEEEAEQKPAAHIVTYKLKADDRNYETLLFNLRKNNNKISSTQEQFMLCDDKMMNSAIEEKILIEKILSGLEKQEFKLYLQFIVDNKTKNIVSAEALSRWETKDNGTLLPGHYIQVMESNGLISHLDYYMFETICRQLHKWRDTEFDAITISCNFTRITLSEEDFIEKIKEISQKYVFDKKKLIIEITEDAIEKNKEVAIANILECKKLGFKVALDDLGSGHTSLINLCEYPIDIVKIDRSILLKTDKKNGKDLFIGMIALAHSLNLQIVCEGVETEEQNDFVSSSKCDLIQGWYYSKAHHNSLCEDFARSYAAG